MDNFIQIRTSYLYPDGDVIDLYFKFYDDCILITDLGETMRWLISQATVECLSENQEQTLQDILTTYGVKESNGELVIHVERIGDIESAMNRLAQAISTFLMQ